MPDGGLFVTLYDKETLRLYLDTGIYGQHLNPEPTDGKASSSFYGTLADYSCIRDGTHVFFFLGREIYYGGQIEGPEDYGGFYLNGKTSEMGRKADADLVWNESERYIEIGESGKFLRQEPEEGNYGDNDIYCQPYLIQFETDELTGNYIISDQFYLAISQYRNLLPGNSITGAGFCTLTPGETKHLLNLMEDGPEDSIEPVAEEDTAAIDLRDEAELTPFKPEYGISRASEAKTELHLEGSLAANPLLYPSEMRPNGDIICRQAPLVPPKPDLRNSDREDLCYYDGYNAIRDGTVPNTIIELKLGSANYETARQIIGYLDSLYTLFGEEASDIEAFVYANRFTDGTYTDKPFDDFITRYGDQIHKRIHDEHISDSSKPSDF